jgi:uncharacterized tellurite resistance protein B-like protein
MHYVIGIITALAGLAWAMNSLHRSGFFDSINPFALFRRLVWQKKYNAKPLHNLRCSMEVAAVLFVGVAKCEGELSTNQKNKILSIFEDEFEMSASEAADLLVAASYLTRDEVYIVDGLNKILQKTRDWFTPNQARKVLKYMAEIAGTDSEMNAEQIRLIDRTEQLLI